jgi:hypothetical protein
MSIKDFERALNIVRAGRTDEEMFRDRVTSGPPAELMIFTKIGDPRPRALPDGRTIFDPDAIRETANMTDDEAMAWFDIPEAE